MNNEKILILIVILIVTLLSVGDLYKVDVDTDYGFYQVRNLDNLTEKISYINKTLEIYIGDTIEWINYADPDEKFTIDCFEIVDKNTFGGIFYHTLRWNYQKYSHTFNKSGTYRIHIDEYPHITSQTIIVKELYILNPILFNNNEISNPEIINISIVTQLVTEDLTSPPIKNTPGFEFIFVIFSLLILVMNYERKM